MKSLQLPFPGRTAMLPLMMGIACLVTTPSARGQSISTSGVMYTGDDGESVEETISIAGNQNEVDGYVSVENESFEMEDTIEYVAAEADLYDAGNLVAEGGGVYEIDSAGASASAPTNVGDTYILDGWAYACFYVYEGDEGDCEPADLGDLQLQLQTGAPYISKIQPASADVGAQPVSITVTGEDLIDAFGVSRVSITGGVNASIGSGESTTQATINYPTLTSSNAGQQTLTISNSFGASNGETFTVGYPSPNVTGLSSSTWYAGSTYTVQITGTNFGTSPSVSIALPSGTIQPIAAPCAGGSADTCVTVTFSVPANCPSGSAPVTVTSNGFNGSGFFPGNSGNSPSNTNNSGQTVFTPPTPTINLTNGTTASPYAGQLISLSVSPPSGSGLTIKTPSWTFGNTNDVIAGFTASTASGSAQPVAATNNQSPLSYYYIVPGASETISVTATYTLADGSASTQSAPASQTFTVGGPTGYSSSSGVAVNMGQLIARYDSTIGLTNYLTAFGYAGIQFQALGSLPSGNPGVYSWVQVITSQTLQVGDESPGSRGSCSLFDPNGNDVVFPALDSSYPYGSAASGTLHTTKVTNDTASDNPKAPTSGIYGPFGELAEAFNAAMYLMWTPASASGCSQQGNTSCTVPVPLGSVAWNFCDDAINTQAPKYPQFLNGGGTANTSPWALQQCTNPSSVGAEQPTFSPNSTYPGWSSSMATAPAPSAACP